MRRLAHYLFRSDEFVKAFADGLRAEFADAASAPLPEYLASCANWRIATRRSQRLFLATPYFPLEIRNPLRKFKAPRRRNPALGHCNSRFQSRGAGRQIASLCETDFAPRTGGLCVCSPK
jgi:hypothetical protein